MIRRGSAVGMRALGIGLLVVGFLRDGIAAPSPAPPATKLAALRHSIEQRVDNGPKHRLSKAEIRPRMKVVMRLLDRCYRAALATNPTISGVVNTGLTIRSDPTHGISLTVTLHGHAFRYTAPETENKIDAPGIVPAERAVEPAS